MTESAGWSSYEKLVLSEIADLKQELSEVRDELTLARIDIATLKVKSGLWGGGISLVVALAAYTASSAGII